MFRGSIVTDCILLHPVPKFWIHSVHFSFFHFHGALQHLDKRPLHMSLYAKFTLSLKVSSTSIEMVVKIHFLNLRGLSLTIGGVLFIL